MDFDSAFSRSGVTNSGGKITTRIDVPCSQELEEAVITLAGMAGVPKAEYLRSLVERAVFGDLALLRRLAKPIRSAQWDESGINEGSRP